MQIQSHAPGRRNLAWNRVLAVGFAAAAALGLPACGNSAVPAVTSRFQPAASAGDVTASVADVTLPALSTPLSHHGRWFTDADGRVVVFHGINVASKLAPYTPQFQGFTKEHAAMLAREGFTTVRVWIFWKAFEPLPGVWDDSSLAATKEFVGWLHEYGITTTLNFSQLLWGEKFGGLGFPDWAAQTDGFPNVALGSVGVPGLPTPGGNLVIDGLTNPAVHRAFDNFYSNTKYPADKGVQDQFDAAWVHVANYFKDVPGIIAYDLLNEPEAGSQDDTCLNPAGCPQFDALMLTPFNEKAVAAIRSVDRAHMVWYEPHVYAAAGTATQVAAGDDPNLALTFHFYPIAGASGITTTAPVQMKLVEQTADQNGDALLLTEFGAKDDLAQIGGIIDAADTNMLGWQYWAWYSTEPTGNPDTPTTQVDHPEEGIVHDPKQPPVESNLKADKLALLGRPYPYLIAGTPTAWRFDTSTKTFTLSYSTTPVAGGVALKVPTVVLVPPRLFPNGYSATVTGATVHSDPAASALYLDALATATSVSLTLGPKP
jgi:endoglycosylceramidase